MLFNSYIFIFIFLPISLIGWFGLHKIKAHVLAKLFLCAMSLWFYAYFNLHYLLIIVCSILCNYTISFLLSKTASPSKFAKRLSLFAGLFVNLGLLFYFKYFDFFLENINSVFSKNFVLRNILLPLGISFFTFQQLSYIIDRSIGKTEHISFPDYICFVTFFPQLIAGPIVLHTELVPQFRDSSKWTFQKDNFSKGIVLFSIGLAKKVLLADILAVPVDFAFKSYAYLDTPTTLLTIIAYSFQLYFDFSGYSDMALGLGRMFNIFLPQNFNSPYKACSVKELWQRWHITLSRFFIQYVYIPLGGSKKGKARTLLNIFIVFVLSGLWHGAAWTYVAWGTMQGLLVVWDNLGIVGVKESNEKIPAKFHIPRWLGWILTYGFFDLSLFFFRSESIPAAITMLKNIADMKVTGFLPKMITKLDIPEFYFIKEAIQLKAPSLMNTAYLLLFILLLIISIILLRSKNALEIVDRGIHGKTAIWISVIFVWSVISFSQVSTFIYFNF